MAVLNMKTDADEKPSATGPSAEGEDFATQVKLPAVFSEAGSFLPGMAEDDRRRFVARVGQRMSALAEECIVAATDDAWTRAYVGVDIGIAALLEAAAAVQAVCGGAQLSAGPLHAYTDALKRALVHHRTHPPAPLDPNRLDVWSNEGAPTGSVERIEGSGPAYATPEGEHDRPVSLEPLEPVTEIDLAWLKPEGDLDMGVVVAGKFPLALPPIEEELLSASAAYLVVDGGTRLLPVLLNGLQVHPDGFTAVLVVTRRSERRLLEPLARLDIRMPGDVPVASFTDLRIASSRYVTAQGIVCRVVRFAGVPEQSATCPM